MDTTSRPFNSINDTAIRLLLKAAADIAEKDGDGELAATIEDLCERTTQPVTNLSRDFGYGLAAAILMAAHKKSQGE